MLPLNSRSMSFINQEDYRFCTQVLMIRERWMKNAPEITGMSTLSNPGPNRYCENSLLISQTIDNFLNNPFQWWLEGNKCIVVVFMAVTAIKHCKLSSGFFLSCTWKTLKFMVQICDNNVIRNMFISWKLENEAVFHIIRHP